MARKQPDRAAAPHGATEPRATPRTKAATTAATPHAKAATPVEPTAASHTNASAPPAAVTTPPTVVEIEGTDEVLVLQFSEPDPLPDIDVDAFAAALVADALAGTRSRPSAGARWCFFLATGRPDAAGLGFWLGVTTNAPPVIADHLQRLLESRGCRVARQHAALAQHSLRPVLAVTPAGWTVPASAPDSVERALPSAVTRAVFRVDLRETWKRALMASLLLGSPGPPLMHLPYFEADEAATFVFHRVPLQMLAGSGDGSVLAMARLSDTPLVVLSFGLDRVTLQQLLAQVAAPIAAGILRAIGRGPAPFRVPEGSILVGIRARSSAIGEDGAQTYIVERVEPATGAGMTVEL